jgi:hypothetical protein
LPGAVLRLPTEIILSLSLDRSRTARSAVPTFCSADCESWIESVKEWVAETVGVNVVHG